MAAKPLQHPTACGLVADARLVAEADDGLEEGDHRPLFHERLEVRLKVLEKVREVRDSVRGRGRFLDGTRFGLEADAELDGPEMEDVPAPDWRLSDDPLAVQVGSVPASQVAHPQVLVLQKEIRVVSGHALGGEHQVAVRHAPHGEGQRFDGYDPPFTIAQYAFQVPGQGRTVSSVFQCHGARHLH